MSIADFDLVLFGGSGDLAMRSDELDAAWEWVGPVLEQWEQDGADPLLYAAGTWRPAWR